MSANKCWICIIKMSKLKIDVLIDLFDILRIINIFSILLVAARAEVHDVRLGLIRLDEDTQVIFWNIFNSIHNLWYTHIILGEGNDALQSGRFGCNRIYRPRPEY